MAWVRCCGGSGIKSKYIYKDGTVNNSLTGGLSTSGYTYASNIGVTGNSATFNANDITISAGFYSSNACMIGTNLQVDLTGVNSIIMSYEWNGTPKTIAYDCSALTGSYYLAFGAYQNQFGSNSAFISASTTKTNTSAENHGNTDSLPYSSTLACVIKEIELA